MKYYAQLHFFQKENLVYGTKKYTYMIDQSDTLKLKVGTIIRVKNPKTLEYQYAIISNLIEDKRLIQTDRSKLEYLPMGKVDQELFPVLQSAKKDLPFFKKMLASKKKSASNDKRKNGYKRQQPRKNSRKKFSDVKVVR